MTTAVSTSFTRRCVVAGLAAAAASTAVLPADNARAQTKQTKPEKNLYERLGGVFAIAAVVDYFSDAVVKNPVVGQKSNNPTPLVISVAMPRACFGDRPCHKQHIGMARQRD